jgi:hypothetical protein
MAFMEKKTIMAREKSHNNTIYINMKYGMAIYGKCPYYFGSPAVPYWPIGKSESR